MSQQLVRQAVSESIRQSVSQSLCQAVRNQFVSNRSSPLPRVSAKYYPLSFLPFHFYLYSSYFTLLISLFLFLLSYFFSLILSRFLLLNSPPIFSQCRHSCLWVLMTHHNWTPLTSLCLCGPLGETLSGSVRRPCMSKYKHSHHLHLSPIMDNII